MLDLLGHIIVISIIWFTLYWIIGGVVFAAISIVSLVKLRRAQFSCLFTLLSLACGFGAAYMGTYMAKARIDVCLPEANDVFGRLASVIACGIFEHVASGLLWFIGMLVLGGMLLIISRASNQSWMDTDEDVYEERLDVLEL